MEINDFLEKFSAQFYTTSAEEIGAETKYKELDEWTSMIALAVILMVDEEYGITINADDIEQTLTVGDLFALVSQKQ